MPASRALFTGGPAYLVFGGVTFQMADDWSVTDNPKEFTVKSNLGGTLDKGLAGVMWEIEFSPLAVSGTLAAMLALLVAPFALKRGALLFPSTDVPVVIQTQAGKSITFGAGAVTEVDFQFATGKQLIEKVKIMCLVKNSTLSTATTAGPVVATSAYTEPNFDPDTLIYDLYTLAFGGTFTDIETKDGVKFSPKLALTARETTNRGQYNATVDDVTAEVSFQPEGLTEADWYDTLAAQDGSTAVIGALRGKQIGLALTVTGSASGMPVLTVPRAYAAKGGLEFGTNSRIKAVTLMATRKAVSSVLQPLFTLATLA